MSNAFYTPYAKAFPTGDGFEFEKLCIALISNELIYDPLTGERLPTWSKYGWFGDHPLRVPTCIAGGQLSFGRGKDGEVFGLDLTGCKIRFDVRTGRKLSPEEGDAGKFIGLIVEPPEAGDSNADANRLALQPLSRATPSQIDALKTILGR
jgi:hypothetical protein